MCVWSLQVKSTLSILEVGFTLGMWKPPDRNIRVAQAKSKQRTWFITHTKLQISIEMVQKHGVVSKLNACVRGIKYFFFGIFDWCLEVPLGWPGFFGIGVNGWLFRTPCWSTYTGLLLGIESTSQLFHRGANIQFTLNLLLSQCWFKEAFTLAFTLTISSRYTIYI